ncbi:MAG: hypothetical protein ACR652_17790 [Methylocystis sp.]|uniref:hypothetical protein n=1 Tax=Methylocystis sp. TaxID=1911079 RepID=UPI003DA6A736
MAKVAKIAAIVVGVAAIALTGGVALFGAPAVLGALGSIGIGLSAAGLTTLTTVLSVSAALLSTAAGLLAKPPKFGSTSAGQQLDFIADPNAGEPYVMGDARVGMNIVHQASWGDKNKFLGIIGALSCAGPIMAYDGLYADNTQVAFSGRDATGYYAGFLYESTQLGARPEASALDMTAPDTSAMPDWDAASKLSSIAAAGLLLVADIDNGKVYSGGVPQLTHQVRGVYGYDARLDGTNGGTGAQRALDESTYAYSANPWVHGSTYAIGRWVDGPDRPVRVIGPGLPVDKVDWPSFIEAANIADANGWSVSGRIMSTDRKWDVLKSIAQAGGGYPIPTAAKLAALVNTPRVSLETIEEAHLKGPVQAPQMSMRRVILNGGVPKFRSPDHAWEVVPGNIVRNADYLAADGGNTKTKEVELPLVANAAQAAQLAAYEVANSRERSPISLELDLYWSQYKMGDCLTLNIPSALLFNQKCVVIGRTLDATKNTVTFSFRTEDDAKHEWALSQTGGAPPATTVGSDPGAGDVGGNASTVLRGSYPKSLRVQAVDTGTDYSITLDGGSAGANFIIDYATDPPQDIPVPAATLTAFAYSSGTYYLFADVTGVGDAAPTYGATTTYGDALNSATHPNRIYLNQSVTIPASGGGTTSGGDFSGGYGGGSGGVRP